MTIVNDNFNRANEDPVSDGGNWSGDSVFDDMRVVSNQLHTDATAKSVCRRAGETIGNDQFSEAIVTELPTGAYAGITVRHSATGTFYVFLQSIVAARHELWERNPSWYQLGANISEAPTVNDKMRLSVEGSDIKCYINDVEVHSHSDLDLTTDDPGIYVEHTSSNIKYDDWRGGDGTGDPSAAAALKNLALTGVGQ